MTVAQTRDLETGDLIPRQIGDVDVEDGVGRQRISAQAGDDFDRSARGGFVMPALVIGGDQRHRDRRQAEEPAFHRGGDGARIDHVVAEVRGVVDAGNDDVGLLLQHPGDGDVDAVGRRAVDAPGVFVVANHADRHVQGQRIAGAGAVAVGRDHQHLVAGLAQASGEDADAGGVDAIIVADQDTHGFEESPCRGRSPRHDTGSVRPIRSRRTAADAMAQGC